MDLLHWSFSERFECYLAAAQRAGVPGDRIRWSYTEEAPEGLRDRNGLHHFDLSADTVRIFLNRSMSPAFSEVVAAHELGHEVLNRQSYPICSGSQEPAIADLVAHINSALTDPPVNELIRGFGYDPSPLYMPSVFAALHDWSTLQAGVEFDDINLRYNALVIANRYRQMTPEQWAQLEPLCQRKSPKAYAMGQDLISIREQHGISSALAVIQTAMEWRSALRVSGLLILLR